MIKVTGQDRVKCRACGGGEFEILKACTWEQFFPNDSFAMTARCMDCDTHQSLRYKLSTTRPPKCPRCESLPSKHSYAGFEFTDNDLSVNLKCERCSTPFPQAYEFQVSIVSKESSRGY